VIIVPLLDFIVDRHIYARQWIGALLAVAGCAFLELHGRNTRTGTDESFNLHRFDKLFATTSLWHCLLENGTSRAQTSGPSSEVDCEFVAGHLHQQRRLLCVVGFTTYWYSCL
jgi:hypothetical protein